MKQTETTGEPAGSHLLYAGKIADAPNWNFPSHKHDDLHEILVITEGRGLFTIGGKVYDVKKGDILIYNKGVEHEEISSADNPIFFYYCGFSFPSLAGSADDWIIPPDQKPVIRSNRSFPGIATLIKMIFEESSVRGEGHHAISHHLMESLLLLIRRAVQERVCIEEENSDTLASQIKEFIDKNYAGKMNLKELGERFHINPYYVSHVFKKNYHTSPINYAIHRRIGEASRLLVTTELKVWEIGKLLGYEDSNYFSIIFKRITGQAPNVFREERRRFLYPRH